MNNLKECQRLLLSWVSLHDKVRYDTIKKYCEYLNEQYMLLIGDHPAWTIFLPLYLAGNIDFCGNNCFKATEPIAIIKKGVCVFTNALNQPKNVMTDFPFIFRSKIVPDYEFKKIYSFNAVSILKHYPSIEDVVNKFEPLPLNDFSSFKFDNWKVKFGIAQKEDWNMNYYFVYPNTRKIVAVPNWDTAPDSINVAYCFSRAIDGRGNGSFNKHMNVLRVTSFRIAIMVYRVLMIESLLEGYNPYKEYGEFVFPGIGISIANEVNRILNNSIKYE